MTKIMIDPRSLSDDIVAGMTPVDATTKYSLSDKVLAEECEQLVTLGLLTQAQVDNWLRGSVPSRETDVSGEIPPEAIDQEGAATPDEAAEPSSAPLPRPGPQESRCSSVVSADPHMQSTVDDQSDEPHGEMRPGESATTTSQSFFSFLGKASLWAVCTLFLGKVFAVYHLWIVVLSVLVFSVPIAASGIYTGTISQIRGLELFSSQGWLFRIRSRRVLRVVFWSLWALCSSFFMLIQFHTYSTAEWVAFFLVIPAFYAVVSGCRRLLARELKGYLVTSFSLQRARGLTPIIMVVVSVVFMTQLGTAPTFTSLQEAVDAQKAAVADMTGSALVAEASQWLAWYNGAKAFVVGNVALHDKMWALLILAMGSYVVFFNACTMLSCFLIPAREYRRLFGPLSMEPLLPPIPAGRIALISAVTTFLIVFIFVPAFTALELWVQSDSRVRETRLKAEKVVQRVVEQVGSDYVKEGTIAEIEKAKAEAFRKLAESRNDVEREADRAFDKVERNVDAYLDWYYSLPAEYARIMKVLTGSLEDYLTETASHYLQRGDAFRALENTLSEALKKHKFVREEYERTVQNIISENRIRPEGTKFTVTRRLGLDDALNPPMHRDIVDFNKRMLGGATAGAIGGTITAIVSTKIMSKIVGKATLKKAAQVMVKVMAGKALGSVGGAGAGAAAGAAIGSAVPVVGTAVGAVVGGIVGAIAAGIAVDKLILMLEEALNRQEFKRELLQAIADARSDFKKTLRGQ